MSKVRHVAEFEEDVELKRLQLSDQDWYSVDVESFKQQLKGDKWIFGDAVLYFVHIICYL